MFTPVELVGVYWATFLANNLGLIQLLPHPPVHWWCCIMLPICNNV